VNAGLDEEISGPAIGWIEWSLRRIESARTEPPADGKATLRALARSSAHITESIVRLETISHRAAAYAMEMDFRFLFDERRKLFSIGYHVGAHQLDASFYDLLASEARLASFIAIAKNDIPVEHWFRLGRTLTHNNGATAMVSWSGSMFEYLMPLLVMQTFPFTLLDQTYHGAVRRHVAYAGERNVPWGISESAYNVRDRHFTYQYRAFGVPDLALKRGLGRDLVIAPYASALAVMVEPARALANLIALDKLGALGEYGFRDALDYSRPDPGETFAVVRNYMAHHIGMGLVALTNALTMQVWQQRFHADPISRSAELLLHERVPRRLVLQEPQEARTDEALPDAELDRPAVREVTNPGTPQPVVALLGHLPYTIMVSACGSGYSAYEGLAVTRWRADGTRDNTGQFAYVRDLESGRVWSAGFQPTCVQPDWYRAHLATDRVTIHRGDGVLETRTEIAVVPEDSAEVRRVTITNNGSAPREVEVTSYGEIVIAPADADRSHPAFSNLFVETEWHEWCTAITATRRPRSAKEQTVWLVHVVDSGGEGERVGLVTCDTDRSRFIGRGRTTRDPIALDDDGPLGMSTGAVLDPIFALRARVRVEPGKSASIAFTTLVATTRERCFELADRYHHPHAAQRGLDLAWTSTQVELRELGITPTDAAVFQEIAGHLFYATPTLRAPQEELEANRGSQPLLWKAGVSGDWPLLLAIIENDDGLPTLRQLLAAHHYWRRRGMMVDIVVLNTRAPSYLQDLNDKVTAAVLASSEASLVDRPGGVYVRRTDIVGEETLRMLRGVARVQILCDGRSLSRILDAAQAQSGMASNESGEPAPRMAARATPIGTRIVRRITSLAGVGGGGNGSRTTPPRSARAVGSKAPRGQDIQFDNGYGGVTADGGYEIRVVGGHLPPVPWVNVIANEHGGFIVSERGAGAMWVESGTFFRLTPWHNDPVVDPPGEVLYLRDEESGDLWTPTPAPLGGNDPILVRHDAGYSAFIRERSGIATDLTVGLAADAGVKISILRITNRGPRPRRLALTAFAEWTLGMLREHTQHQVRTTYDAAHGAIIARNYFNAEFSEWSAFFAASETPSSYTGDRRGFLGRNGGTHDPVALRGSRPLDGETGVGLDPCAALQWPIELDPGETREIVVVLGAAASDAETARLLATYRDPGRARASLEAGMHEWKRRLTTITVRTPDPSFDVMVNHWLLYQALSSRMLGRMALYQSSGAYGFRDQLQDSLAFIHAEQGLARAHIVRAAGRQFPEGDVQHWWHPHSGRGVRTRFSDDLAWLPYIVDGYITATGDASVLDEQAPFITMRQLEPHEHEVYDLPMSTDRTASVYDHCVLALRRACTVGAHGLPLIGIGDWNDGMNRVGVEGRGESVWLAWFLTTTLRAFADRAEARDDHETAIDFRRRADDYVRAIEETSWDGAWYRRAYFDDGTPLGSAANDECRIDSIAQSWSVISGAGRPDRQAQAMRALDEHLVRDDARLIMLLTPAFDRMAHDPGYIKGYLPGVRENGAQYTHAALWAVLATAIQGDGDRAFDLFQMINPLTHGRTREEVAVYKVEPYVVAADVYTAPGHLGRGGWTWYTGSASWMYRVAVEAILGLTKRGDVLSFAPRVPAAWRGFQVTYRHGSASYEIALQPTSGNPTVTVDGERMTVAAVPLADDGRSHTVVVEYSRS
jgi:cyclic beta-1,2-glucan synthetase